MAELRLVRTWTGAHLQICVLSHLSPAVSWIVNPYRMVQKWSPLSEFMACPYSVRSALHLRCGTLCLPRPLNPRDETANHRSWFRDGVDHVAELWPCGVVVACLLHTQEVPGSIPGRGSYLRQVSLH